MPILIILVILLIYAAIHFFQNGINGDALAKIIFVVLAIAALITLAYAPIAFLIIVAVIVVAVFIRKVFKNNSINQIDKRGTKTKSDEEIINTNDIVSVLSHHPTDCSVTDIPSPFQSELTETIGISADMENATPIIESHIEQTIEQKQINSKDNPETIKTENPAFFYTTNNPAHTEHRTEQKQIMETVDKKEIINKDIPDIIVDELPTDFQYELLRNMRTKEEVQNANIEELRKRAMTDAIELYEAIKRNLIIAVNSGKYEVINDKKVAYSDIMMSNMGIRCQEKLQCRGFEVDMCRRFEVDISSTSVTGCLIQYIKDLAKGDNIAIDFCAKREYDSRSYPINTDIYNTYIDDYGYYLSFKASTIIPDAYSNKQVYTSNIDISVDETPTVIDYDTMEGHDFEKFCAELLCKNGYTNVVVTKGSGDQGIDIIAYKDSVKFGIQCKCYSSDIGNKAVQEAFAGKTYYDCHVGVVLTNRYFTSSAVELAKRNGIILWDRDRLNALIENTKK